MFRSDTRFLLWHRWVLLCFALSIFAGHASAMVSTSATEIICSAGGSFKLVKVNSAESDADAASADLPARDCVLCIMAGAPPFSRQVAVAQAQPLGRALQPIVSARIAGATTAPLPARGPPHFL